MKSEDLAQYVMEMASEATQYDYYPDEKLDRVLSIVRDAQSRIMGVGNEQYSEGDKQKFELVPIDKLMAWGEEETVDQINYGVMVLIRIRDLGEGYDPTVIQDLELRCLDLINGGIEGTLKFQEMRSLLTNARLD